MTSYLQLKGLKKTYGDAIATQDVNLEIKKGEFMTFLGPSGSGKSTTLYIISGFQDPTEGDVLLDGKSILQTPSHKRQIGMVFQRYTLFPHLTVAENVAFPLKVRRISRSEIETRVKRVLSLVRLDGFADRMPAEMSGGQQQRVALARALIYDPPVLLMDEPLSALDKKLREEIQFEIRRVHQETGVTILYVTHDQEEALRLSDRIAIFNAGRIEQEGTGPELYANPRTHFVADFIGDSAFVSAKVTSRNGDHAALQFQDGNTIKGVRLSGDVSGDTAEVLMRPEHLTLSGTVNGDAGLPVVLKDTTFLGNHVTATVATSWGEEVAVRIAHGDPVLSALKRDAPFFLGWNAAQLQAFGRPV